MRKIGFIGAFDKTDMLLNIAKILTTLHFSVLVVDSSINQKARYVVPSVNPTVTYITSFDNIDVAIGFKSEKEIQQYVGNYGQTSYDILLVDCDTPDRVESFRLENAYINYFVTSFDMYSLRRGMEILDGFKNETQLVKIYFTREALREDDDYLNFISKDKRVVWYDQIIYFPIENGDFTVIAENQRVEKIKFKKLSTEYKDSIIYITQQILDQASDTNISRAVKLIERGV